MAKVRTNIFVRGLQGNLGGQFYVTVSKVSGRTTVSALDDSEKQHEYSPAQLAQQQAFREASAYAKAMRGEQIYITKADGTGKSPYNIAMADWFHRPSFREVDLTAWKAGEPGLIRVNAYDDVQVVSVSVRISDQDGFTLEEGQATNVGALWWEYPTTGELTGKLSLTLTARDLPGHETVYTQERTLNAA